MLKSAIHLLLATQLAACPVLCGMLSKIHAAREQATPARSQACSQCCQAPHDVEPVQRSAPATPTECPCKVTGRNCICSGALVESVNFELSIVSHPFDCLPAPAGAVVSDRTATPTDPLHINCLPECDGRTLRALICSFLC
ncbi:MAG: hypothetical protein HQ567_04990 [Candidatus Nealsonbacteria bacterium]|nr:hypothetical protein [Candidatus Nealsonbacteria bacterium]